MRETIAVITAAHPARIRNGMLAQATDSVYRQTLLPEEHHVAIDTDREGSAVTRTRALMAASTRWVAFLDSDDLFLPKHLEWLIAHALDTQADYVYAWFKVLQHFADGTSCVLEDDPVFPLGHYLNEFDPQHPIETTVTVLVRTELAKTVGFHNMDRGHTENAGDDAGFTLGCLAAGATIKHLRRKSWLWRHHSLAPGKPGNTSGMPGRGDDA